jgi:16S rRNA (guanine1516-N2)-methyltransferase
VPQALLYLSDADALLAQETASALGVPVRRGERADASGGCVLLLKDGRFSLAAPHGRSVVVSDLNPLESASFRRRLARVSAAEMLVKAMGKRAQEPRSVLDATAGTGADAILLAAAGYRVTACERDPAVALLLRQTLASLSRYPEHAGAAALLSLYEGGAEELLAANGTPPHAVYMDPMFHKKGSALASKEMFLLQRLTGKEEGLPSAEGLLRKAREAGAGRVVVKRHAKAAPLCGAAPSFCVRGKAVRYDVYA